MDNLTIDFSKLKTVEAIEAEVLPFLKTRFSEIQLAPNDPPAGVCEVHERGAAADFPRGVRDVTGDFCTSGRDRESRAGGALVCRPRSTSRNRSSVC